MFKNLMVFVLNTWNWDVQAMEEPLGKEKFTPCTPTQVCSIGWVPPRGIENGPLVECINGQYLLVLQIEEKAVPSDVIKNRLHALCDQIERETGKRPGRKYQRELKEQVFLELLPHAFPRLKRVKLWINPKNKWLMTDSTSGKLAGTVTTMLCKTFDKLAIRELRTNTTPAMAMMDWLLNETHDDLSVDMNCRLKSENEIKTVISYFGKSLDTPEVIQYIKEGMQPEQLALTWRKRISFVLTDDLVIKRIQFRDIVFDASKDVDEDLFDSDAMIATGELLPLLEYLFTVLDGVQQQEWPDAIPNEDQDELYERAVELVQQSGKASISYVQRHLGIGYSRAARLMEAMEITSVVSPMDSSGCRKVIYESGRAVPA